MDIYVNDMCDFFGGELVNYIGYMNLKFYLNFLRLYDFE